MKLKYVVFIRQNKTGGGECCSKSNRELNTYSRQDIFQSLVKARGTAALDDTLPPQTGGAFSWARDGASPRWEGEAAGREENLRELCSSGNQPAGQRHTGKCKHWSRRAIPGPGHLIFSPWITDQRRRVWALKKALNLLLPVTADVTDWQTDIQGQVI